jgi:isohexenylglutaconyl-CoA hydratase
MPDYANIILAREGAVARLTLNRPERRNALNHAMMLELEDAFGRVRDDRDCRVLVLRGAGGHFSAGGDLDAMADMPAKPGDGPDPLVSHYRRFGGALLTLNELPQATIAVVEGAAVGGGFGMACCSDVVILHDSARFGIPEPKVGFIPSQILPFLARRIGQGVLRDMAVTSRLLDAEEALRLGIGRHRCSTTADIAETLRAIVDDILKGEPLAIATVKRLVRSAAATDDRSLLDSAAESLVELLRRPQTEEGIKAFKTKTSPPWAKSQR